MTDFNTAAAALVHFGAPGEELECDTVSTNVTEDDSKVTCPACRAAIAPWVDGEALRAAAPTAGGDNLGHARKLFPSVFAMLEG